MSAERQLQSVNMERLRGAMRAYLVRHFKSLGRDEGTAYGLVGMMSDSEVQALIEKRYEGGLDGFIRTHMTLRVVK